MAYLSLLSPERLVLDPDWQPFAYDASGDGIVFAQLPRAAQRQLTFLDRRFTQDRLKAGPIAIKAMPRAAARAQAGPLHFIFHTAFCCSTLLTRAFDIPGASMGLKEPEILGSFADALQARPNDFAVLGSLGVALDLLSRPLSAGETQIAKASNLANTIVPHLLDARADAKAIFMHSTLETYLQATAQRMLAGRAFNREALLLFHPVMPLSGDLTHDVMLRLTDLEIAAVVWLMQVRFLNTVAARYGAARVRTLAGKTLLERPAETLERAGAFFGIELPQTTSWDEIAAGPVFREHAKSLGRPYDAERRRADLEAAGTAYRGEIEAVMQWAENLAAKSGAPLMLGDTLLNAMRSQPALGPRHGSAAQPTPRAPHHS